MAWSKRTRISVMLAIDIVFFLVELTSGFMVHSLALMADAFHMLNDIISLLVGLWAVSVASRATTDKYSYGWLRAEILGAFFNAVFLIALCVSIILEAVTRLLDPPVISNPQLILIVGCCGLASNIAGFFVLGGHGHSHGPGDHSHGEHGDHGHDHVHEHEHNEAAAVEEGRSLGFTADDGPAMDILPHVALARAQGGSDSPETVRRIQYGDSEHSASHSSGARGREHRRPSTLKLSRLQSIDDLNPHPASFRQNIINQSRTDIEDTTDESSTEGGSTIYDELNVDERTPLVAKTSSGLLGPAANASANGKHKKHSKSRRSRSRRDSAVHREHNHNKPKTSKKGGSHGHNHADMGMRAMVLHVIGDALGNVGVIATALIIWLTEWSGKYYADPAVSLFITAIILHSAYPLTKATSKVLLQATPDGIDLQDIKEDIQALPGVISCHHVHVWQLSDTKVVASMHVQVAFPITEEGGEKYMALAKQARKCLHAYGIHSATIQPEFCLDDRCNHAEVATGLDGQADGSSTPYCGSGHTVPCLLECVDDCVEQGCCTVPSSQNDEGSTRSSHSGHNHGENGNGAAHAHENGHDHNHH
ncbi:cation efflux protein [Pseudomassariella vexata]|uniref:Cation efflux protein n=1 Tax=Pseudomassariella vexata TaxID=1141098 RepID=A0A1Y2DD34_9PEZI|nr:cation efflux protein [Pseudomassariella vexata]ORY57181.1 cation efflux protein [Pseudomassariella vexata]